MEIIGYSKDIIQCRRKLYNEFNIHRSGYCNMVGSKGEGIARFLESDQDFIVDFSELYCTDSASTANKFKFRFSETHPGYGKIQVTKDHRLSNGKDQLDLKKGLIVNQRLFQEFMIGEYVKMLSTLSNTKMKHSGPAFSFCVNEINFDFVGSIPFHCPTLIKKWVHRQRDHNWPPKAVIQTISDKDANLVAIGCNACQSSSQEYRVCFNAIEILLVEQLNDTQIKLYQILKMIKSYYLTSAGFDVTSFMIKNVVFWLAEQYPQSQFRPDSLCFWVKTALEELKAAARKGFMSYYMIPERNIFAEKIQPEENRHLERELDIIIRKDIFGLRECERIKAVKFIPICDLPIYKEKRNMLERLFLIRHTKFSNLVYDGLTGKENDYYSEMDKINSEIESIKASGWPLSVQLKLQTTPWEEMQKLFFG